MNIGYIARLEAPNNPVSSFSQEDIDLGKIMYVHNRNTTGEDTIALQVSDGMLSSSISFLRLSIITLQLHLVSNTGIMLSHKSFALITRHNLSFQTNADDPLLNIKYEIIDFPKYGAVQCLVRLKNDQEAWQAVTSFTDQHIMREEVRYMHTKDTSSSFDIFKFKVGVKNLVLPTIYEFKTTFVQLQLIVVANETVEVIKNQTTYVTESNLKVITEPLATNSSAIEYTLLQAPRVLGLMLGDRTLKINSTWLQKDITDNKLVFQLSRETFSEVHDYIIFSVSAPQCQTIDTLFLYFKYHPTEEQSTSIQVSVRLVQVPEGGQQPLLVEHLNVLKDNVSLVVYQVLEEPKHGTLDMYDIDHTTIEKRNVTLFVNTDIMKQKITYTHDDSESMSDAIYLLAFGGHGENFQYVTELNFEILLKNDNPPFCIVNNGLNVVIGGDKILTDKDLLYGDPDIDAKPETISYTRRAIPNGSFTLSDPPYSPLFEFSQNDINTGRVMFRHSGPLSANVSMWVSDGNSFSEFIFDITASAPYVKVVNNSKLLLRQGGEAVITTNNLYSSTNINLPLQLIRYKVQKQPEIGQLILAGEPGSVQVFTQEDIEKKALTYRHTEDIKSVKDKFTFQVGVQDIYVEDDFHVRLFPDVYWEPLVLVNNRTLYVEEASDILITRDDLLVQQARVPPSDISYFVVEQPKYGYLEIEVNGRYLEVDFNYLFHPNSSDDSKDTAITFFDQAIVDAEKLHYIQVILNQTYDRVVLDATNGIVWFRNIVLNFEIIPEQLYISGNDLHVAEGEIVRLPHDLFSIYSPYYAEKITEYRLKKFPQHGWLQFTGFSSKSGNISRWTSIQLQSKQVQYVHDGSETTNDSMLVIAFANEKESLPAKVNIIISPVNDELPVIVNNTGAFVWRGGVYNINSSNLAVVDRDTPATSLTFVIVDAKAGYLAYFSNLNATIDKFTQAEIDAGKITFVHSGEEMDGEFEVVINDGRHTTEPVTFKVKILLPTLHLSKSIGFQVFPMLGKAVTSLHLLTWCSDTDKNIFYIVKTPPKYGLLTMVDSDLQVPVSNFSQADVNASRIWYQHKTHIIDADTSNDSFWFDVVASYATPILNEVFDIKVAVSSGGLDSVLDLDTYKVEEGGNVTLFVNTTKLTNFLSSDNIGLHSPSLKAVISARPLFGDLCIHNNCSISELTNEQMNSGILYKHDHSDSKFDNVTLTLYLEQDNITLCNITVRIIINPVNDQPFKLIQDSPNLSVVQGEKFVLTQEQLLTVDKDSSPAEIVYEVMYGPDVGSLYVNGVKGVGKFTQADVNAGRVMYEHSGPVRSCSFHFRVSDGNFNPTYRVFNIFVHEAKLSVVVTRPVLLMQGNNSVVITSSIFNVQTNHKMHEVTYGITTSPLYGFILVNNAPSTTFTHNNLKSKEVVYVQSDLTVASDTFELEAALLFSASYVKNLWVNISVEPLLKIGVFTPQPGRNCINEDVLNAAVLAKKSNSNPVFNVIKKPKYGKLQKIIKRNRKAGTKTTRESRTVKQEDIDKFTFDEINSKVIYYVGKKVNVSIEDSFAFLLSANMVQPAIGELRFHLNPESTMVTTLSTPKQKLLTQMKVKITTKTPLSVPETSDVEIASPNMTTDDYYLVSLLSGVLIVSFIFVILVRCRSKKRAEEDTKTNPPLPLPRPPDELLPSSPYPKRNMLHSTPQCKVIPLGTDSLTSSEHDFNLRYPYGAADEDWSSCDTNGYSTRNGNNNPMLRKNQYWV